MQRLDRPKRLLSTLAWGAAAVFLAWARAPSARAHDVGDEFTLGRFSGGGAPATGYWSDRLDGAVDLSDAFALDASMRVTHYDQSKTQKPSSIFDFGLGGSYMPDEHWTFDADAYLSPQSVNVEKNVELSTQPVRFGAVRDRSSAFGFSLGGEYDTAGDGDVEGAFGLAAGLTSYSSTQAVRLRMQRLSAMPNKARRVSDTALLQWRGTASASVTLASDTDLAVAQSLYLYGKDTTGYAGPEVLGRLNIGDGIPLEPLLYSVRPSITHRFGSLQLRGYFQYGDYDADAGWGVIVGARVQYKFSRLFRAWISGNLQHDSLASALEPQSAAAPATRTRLNILWASAGARFVF